MMDLVPQHYIMLRLAIILFTAAIIHASNYIVNIHMLEPKEDEYLTIGAGVLLSKRLVLVNALLTETIRYMGGPNQARVAAGCKNAADLNCTTINDIKTLITHSNGPLTEATGFNIDYNVGLINSCLDFIANLKIDKIDYGNIRNYISIFAEAGVLPLQHRLGGAMVARNAMVICKSPFKNVTPILYQSKPIINEDHCKLMGSNTTHTIDMDVTIKICYASARLENVKQGICARGKSPPNQAIISPIVCFQTTDRHEGKMGLLVGSYFRANQKDTDIAALRLFAVRGWIEKNSDVECCQSKSLLLICLLIYGINKD